MISLTGLFMVVEFIAGILANSLALISDAGHMLNDVFSLSLAYLAIIISSRPPNSRYTFGMQRFEVVSGFINGLSLIVIAGYILFEAVQRSFSYTEVEIEGNLVLITAIVGLVVNLIGIFLLHRDHFNSVNIQAAYSHIIADALGSIGALITGIGILLYQAFWLDIVSSIIITLLVLRSGISVTRKSLSILLEAVPEHVDSDQLLKDLQEIQGVESVCDFHIWRIANDHDMLTAHIIVDDLSASNTIQQESAEVAKNYGFKHITIQIEETPCISPEGNLH